MGKGVGINDKSFCKFPQMKHFEHRLCITRMIILFHHFEFLKMKNVIKLLFACAVLTSMVSCSSSYKACAAYSKNDPVIDNTQTTVDAKSETSLIHH